MAARKAPQVSKAVSFHTKPANSQLAPQDLEPRDSDRHLVAKTWDSLDSARTAVADALEAMGIGPQRPDPNG